MSRQPLDHTSPDSFSRRTFLQGAGALLGGTTVLASCQIDQADPSEQEGARHPWVKDPSPFIQHPTNLETRLEDLHGYVAPNDRFFVRNHAPTPRIDRATYQLRIEGDGVETPIDLGYDDLLRMSSHSTLAYLECAGNWRGFYPEVYGKAASGGQWKTGAVGAASWSGVSLGTALERAGLRSDAVAVNLFGADEGSFNRPMPIAKALESDTLLAYGMNGATLPPDNGFPVRAVVPGWVGSNSVKWVQRIEVSRSPIWTKNNTTSYVLIGDGWQADQFAPADGGPITTLNVKSTLALPRPAQLSAGLSILRGFAYSPYGRIRTVEWRVDDGAWAPARLVEPILDRMWTRFECDWTASPGSYRLTVRAVDALGNGQPETAPPNEKGYLLNIPVPHPVEVV